MRAQYSPNNSNIEQIVYYENAKENKRIRQQFDSVIGYVQYLLEIYEKQADIPIDEMHKND